MTDNQDEKIISNLYQDMDKTMPPKESDVFILNAAHKKTPYRFAWLYPTSAAATLLLTFVLMLDSPEYTDQQMKPSPDIYLKVDNEHGLEELNEPMVTEQPVKPAKSPAAAITAPVTENKKNQQAMDKAILSEVQSEQKEIVEASDDLDHRNDSFMETEEISKYSEITVTGHRMKREKTLTEFESDNNLSATHPGSDHIRNTHIDALDQAAKKPKQKNKNILKKSSVHMKRALKIQNHWAPDVFAFKETKEAFYKKATIKIQKLLKNKQYWEAERYLSQLRTQYPLQDWRQLQKKLIQARHEQP